jgi:hypothetical protein
MNNIKSEICSWLKEQIAIQNKKALLVYIENNNIYSVLNHYFCNATQIPIHAIIDSNDFTARQFCIKNQIPHSSFTPFVKHVDELIINVNFPGMNKIIYKENYDKIYELEKTAFISYVAETTNSLYSGNITRNDYYFVRNFPKVNCYDLLPFVNFSETELLNIITNFSVDISIIAPNFIPQNSELEWIFDLNRRTKVFWGVELAPSGIIEKDADPTHYEKWYAFTSSQKALIAKIHQQEKLTRHKKINGEIFKLSKNDE